MSAGATRCTGSNYKSLFRSLFRAFGQPHRVNVYFSNITIADSLDAKCVPCRLFLLAKAKDGQLRQFSPYVSTDNLPTEYTTLILRYNWIADITNQDLATFHRFRKVDLRNNP